MIQRVAPVNRAPRRLSQSRLLRAFLLVEVTLVRLRRDRLTNLIGVKVGLRVVGVGVARGKENNFFCLLCVASLLTQKQGMHSSPLRFFNGLGFPIRLILSFLDWFIL